MSTPVMNTTANTATTTTNAATPMPPKRKAATANRDYAAFLPAALEISTLPPPRVVPVLIVTIIAALAAALVWSSVSVLDVYTNAAGRVRSTVPSAVVQPQETGRVTAIQVANGKAVKAGDPLVLLDDVAVLSALNAAEAGRLSWLAEVTRRKAATVAVEANRFDLPAVAYDPAIPEAVIARETQALRSDLQTLQSALLARKSQEQEAEARRQRFTDVKAVKERLLSILAERVKMQEDLQGTGAGSRATLLSVEDQKVRVEADLADTSAQLVEIEASIRNLAEQQRQVSASYLSDQAKGIQAAERQIEQLDQEIVKQTDRKAHLVLRAPITGTVQQLSVASTGQVVNPGQPLMVIVPDQADRIVEALVPSQEIGFVEKGNPVVIKADAFPFTRYGTFTGTVTDISDDAVTIRDAQGLQDPNALATGQAAAQPNGIPSVSGLYYIARITLDSTEIKTAHRTLKLEPGMTVRAEIKTESHSVIDYILSPVYQVISETGHER